MSEFFSLGSTASRSAGAIALALLFGGCAALSDAKRNRILLSSQTFENFKFALLPKPPAASENGELVVSEGDVTIGVMLHSDHGILRIVNSSKKALKLMVDESVYFDPFGSSLHVWNILDPAETPIFLSESLSQEPVVVMPKEERKFRICPGRPTEARRYCAPTFLEAPISTEEAWNGSLQAASMRTSEVRALEDVRRQYGAATYSDYRRIREEKISQQVGKEAGFDFALSLGGGYKVIPLRFILGEARSLGVFNVY